MTGFSAIKSTKKTKKRGWSLPCRVIWEKQKVLSIKKHETVNDNCDSGICCSETLYTISV